MRFLLQILLLRSFLVFVLLIIIIIILLWVFFFYYGVNWWSFTGVWVAESLLMSPFRAFLSILADLNNAVVRKVSLRPPISNSFSPLSKHWGPFQARQLQSASISPSCSTAILVLWQGLSTCLCFCLLWFSLCGSLGGQNPVHSKLSFKNYNLSDFLAGS